MILYRSPALHFEVMPTVPVLQDRWGHSRSRIHRPPTTRPAYPLQPAEGHRTHGRPGLASERERWVFYRRAGTLSGFAISRRKDRLDDEHEEDLLVFESCRCGNYPSGRASIISESYAMKRKERGAPSPSRANLVLISSSVKLQAAHQKASTQLVSC
jgi:hypothetical protein